jgi:hypothetical protein
MTLDIEAALRETLNDRAQQFTPDADPWPKFEKENRRHRRGRRARGAAAIVAGTAAIAVLGSGAVPLPSWVPALTIDNASSALLNEPTAGSLAADEEWLSAFRAELPELFAEGWESDPERQSLDGDGSETKIIFAGDVSRQRVVIANVPTRNGLLRRESTVWFTGPIGADPADMRIDGGGGPALNSPYLARVDGHDDEAHVLVLAPDDSRVEVSGSVEYRTDGRVQRTWETVPQRATGEYAAQVPGPAYGVFALRIAPPGESPERRHFDMGSWSDTGEPEALGAAINSAIAEHGSGDRELAQAWFTEQLLVLGLQPEGIEIRVLWAGEIDGDAAMLLAVQPNGGGVLLFAAKGAALDEGVYGADGLLRLLAPADGAYTRPYAWRLDASPSGNVFVVVPAEAVSAEIRLDNGTSIPVELDRTGAGFATADADRMTVVAFDAKGDVMAETPIPPVDTEQGVPGETPATSVVLNEE